MSSENEAKAPEVVQRYALRMPEFMPMMDENFRTIAKAMRWTEVVFGANRTGIFTVDLLGPYIGHDMDSLRRDTIARGSGLSEATAIARMRVQAVDIARASADVVMRNTIDVARNNIRVAEDALNALEREGIAK